jgi:hypothetical protein
MSRRRLFSCGMTPVHDAASLRTVYANLRLGPQLVKRGIGKPHAIRRLPIGVLAGPNFLAIAAAFTKRRDATRHRHLAACYKPDVAAPPAAPAKCATSAQPTVGCREEFARHTASRVVRGIFAVSVYCSIRSRTLLSFGPPRLHHHGAWVSGRSDVMGDSRRQPFGTSRTSSAELAPQLLPREGVEGGRFGGTMVRRTVS